MQEYETCPAKNRGCADEVFALKFTCENYLLKGNAFYVAFIDLEKAYDRDDREKWQLVG